MNVKDKIFKFILFCSGMIILLLVAGIFYALITQSLPAFERFGFFRFISSPEWDDGRKQYGALLFITGSFITATLALIISIPFSISLSLLCEGIYKEKKIARITSYIVYLMSNIPSIIIGVWAYYSLRPILISLNIGQYGYGIISASLVLAIMIIPYSSYFINILLSIVPKKLKEAAYSLGATRFDVIWMIVFPCAKRGIFGVFILAFVKVLGESIIAVLLIGNMNQVPDGITDTGNTMASIILNQCGSADDLKFSSLFAIALLLFLITSIVTSLAYNMIRRYLK